MSKPRDHGGGLDAAAARYGGQRADWLDLSTGINPCPYSIGPISEMAWSTLPDSHAQGQLDQAARDFWTVPDGQAVLAAPGASALIARLPGVLGTGGRVFVSEPTYNEWAAAFAAEGWEASEACEDAEVSVYVHPNNPTGALAPQAAGLTIYDESFCDCLDPVTSFVGRANADTLILKSFGKFWGLAGLRLGFLIGAPDRVARMAEALGPWPVAGPALEIGARALRDTGWAARTRARLQSDADRLDALMVPHCATPRGTSLFRLYEFEAAPALHAHLARSQIWTRAFPYNRSWLRLGLPGSDADWAKLENAIARF